MPPTEPTTKGLPSHATPTKGELSGTQVGGYLVGPMIGRGGMGEVYRGKHLQLSREVAIKVISSHASSDPQWRTRFQREARVLGALDSPNAVRVFDFGETPDGREYLVMELVDGTDVAGLIEQKGRVRPSDALAIAKRVCYALSAAHAVGVVHRDIKPSNVLITKKYVKVADFGLSRPMEGPAASQAGAIIGTPHYMSPEQCEGRTLDGRSDLYNLGAMLYHMLAGDPPYVSTQPLTVLLQHANPEARPVPLTTRVPGTPPELDALVQRLMAKDPDHRPPTADAAAREIDTVLKGLRDGTTAIARDAMPEDAQPPRLSRLFLAICALAILVGGGTALAVHGQLGGSRPDPIDPTPTPTVIDPRRQIDELAAMASDAERLLGDVKLRHDLLVLQFPAERAALEAIYRHALQAHLLRATETLFSDVRAGRAANVVGAIDRLDARAQSSDLADEISRWQRIFIEDLGVATLVVERCVADASGESGRVHAVAWVRPKGGSGESQIPFSLPFVVRQGKWALAWSPLLAEFDLAVEAAIAALAEWAAVDPTPRELGERVDRMMRLSSRIPKARPRLRQIEHDGRQVALRATATQFADAFASGKLARAVDHVYFIVGATPNPIQRDVAQKWLEGYQKTATGEKIEAMFVADKGKGAKVVDDKSEVGEVEFVVGLSAAAARREKRILTHWVLDRRSMLWRIKLDGTWR